MTNETNPRSLVIGDLLDAQDNVSQLLDAINDLIHTANGQWPLDEGVLDTQTMRVRTLFRDTRAAYMSGIAELRSKHDI
jgi:hypothetical protein